jgi:hypothetical protein
MKTFIIVSAIAIGLAATAPASAAHTVSEACGECELPPGMEQYLDYEVLVEIYDNVVYHLPEVAPPLVALTRRLVARQPGFSTTVLIDQIVVEGNVIGYTGPGLVVDVVVIQDDGSTIRYERRLQEVVEFIFIMQYGINRRW